MKVAILLVFATVLLFYWNQQKALVRNDVTAVCLLCIVHCYKMINDCVFFLPVDRNAYQASDEAQMILADAIAMREKKDKECISTIL